MLVWIDLETTGLDPDVCEVLEVAAIITDDNLNEVARLSRTVWWQHTDADIARLHPAVVEMHTANGLFADTMSVSARNLWFADSELADFIVQHAHNPITKEDGTLSVDMPQLAGSTISFDRGFMAKHLRRSLKQLHYRNVDVSTLNELARRFWPDVYAARPNNETKAHRGMADIEESIRVCKHYINAFGAKL